MSRGESPGTILSIASTLTYDPTKPYGHESAGKDLALGFDGTLVGDNDAILGQFLQLRKNKKASYVIDGEPLILRKGFDTDGSTLTALNPGDLVVGAANGKIKKAAASVAGTQAARFRVLEAEGQGDNARIKVIRA